MRLLVFAIAEFTDLDDFLAQSLTQVLGLGQKKETMAVSSLSAKYIAVSRLFNESALHMRQSPSLEKTNYVQKRHVS